MKILFMGTPAYAIPTLNAIVSNHHTIVGIVTRTDKPNRRGNKIVFSPVKEWGLTHNIPIFQPTSMHDPC
ncbi:MAG TPA: methionyl-tRNA formyltransferase, partial [Methanocorpusculum sp.]|nr:methionyl-tRNA formyltransferase [Methanocorpusculum sp.]